MTTTTPFRPIDFTPASRVAGVRPYAPPPRRPWIDLPLDANEGPQPAGGAIDALRRQSAETVRRYPDASSLESRLARRWGVDPARVVVTAGGDDAIDRACRACLAPGRTLVTHAPSFEMITRSARLAGADVRVAQWLCRTLDSTALIDLIDDSTGLVALVSPNNPTGVEMAPADVRRIADAAADRGAMTLLDAAYGEFTDRDATREMLNHPSVFVVRTFSKAFGLAGLRVGYCIAPTPTAAGWLRAAGGPYPVATASLAAADAALSDEGSVERFVDRVRAERQQLTALLRELGADPIESGANFVTAFFPDAYLTADALSSVGIAVRSFTEGPMSGSLRITLPGREDDFTRLTAALRAALEPEAVLFDLDGVIADVSRSYRAAIVETVRALGANVTLEDVARIKAEGDANNDWEVSRRLIERILGSAPPLAEVTERFQSVYLGRNGSPGLRERERLLMNPNELRALARRKRLAMVTGRPREEAAWFLERFDLRAFFEVVIAQEDALAKPDPAPVRLALKNLGVRSAWMIGDTVDDIRAARAAGVVSLGVAADEMNREALLGAGAARVAPSAGALLEVIP
jgi:histidinol-phosphate aminotransferase